MKLRSMGGANPRVALLTLLVAAGSACQDGYFVDPAVERGSGIAISYSLAAAGDPEAAFQKADHVHVRITGSLVLDTVLAFAPADDRVRLALDATGAEGQHRVQVEVLQGSSTLFEGETSVILEKGKSTAAEIALVPVSAGVSLPDSVPPLTAIGDTVVLDGTAVFATGDAIPGIPLSWSSSNTSVVTVDGAGRVVAVAPGTAEITAMLAGRSATVAVVVSPVVHQVVLTPLADTLAVGTAKAFTATAQDRRGHPMPRTFTWSSSAPQTASVDSAGVVTVLQRGPVTIRATVDGVDGDVPVLAVPRISWIHVSPRTTTFSPGDTMRYEAVAVDSTGAIVDLPITWYSTIPSRVSMDPQTGLATALALGGSNVVARAAGNMNVGTSAQVCTQAAGFTGGLMTLHVRPGVFRGSGSSAGDYDSQQALFGGGLVFGTDRDNTVVGYDLRGAASGVDPTRTVCARDQNGGRYTFTTIAVTKADPVPPIEVVQETFTTGDGFVLVRYTFTNVGLTPATGLRAGLALDWDLIMAGSFGDNFARYNPSLDAAEAFDVGGNIVGAAAVGGGFITSYSAPMNAQNDPVTAGDYYDVLGGGISGSTVGPGDIRHIIGFGPLSALSPGASMSIMFTLAGGRSENEFAANITAARAAVSQFPFGF